MTAVHGFAGRRVRAAGSGAYSVFGASFLCCTSSISVRSLPSIGIHSPSHRKRALAIGESLGIFRDYPVSKGCTSPFAPIWINEMVRRKG